MYLFASCDNWTRGDAVKGIQMLNPVSPGSFVFNSAVFGLIGYPSHWFYFQLVRSKSLPSSVFQCHFLLLPRSCHWQPLQGPSGFCLKTHEALWVSISFSVSIRVPPTSRFKSILTCFSSLLMAIPHFWASLSWWTWVWAKLQELVKDRGSWCDAVHGVRKRQVWLSELHWTPFLISVSVPVIYC